MHLFNDAANEGVFPDQLKMCMLNVQKRIKK